MRGHRILCAPILGVAVALGLSLATGSAVRLEAATAGSSAQQKPAAAKVTAPNHNAIPLKSIPVKNPIAMSDASIKAGRTVYARICRDCHGLNAKGDGIKAPPGTKPANLTDAEWKYGGSDAEIFKTIKGGITPFDVMEAWGKKISDTDIWNTIIFLRDLGTKAATRGRK